MKAFSKEIVEKIKSMPDDRKKQVLEGLAKLDSIRPYRASEEFMDNSPPVTEVAIVSPQRE